MKLFRKHIELDKDGNPLKDWEISLRIKTQMKADAKRLELAHLITDNYYNEEWLPYFLHGWDNEGYLSSWDRDILGKPIFKGNEYWDSLPDYGVTEIRSYGQFIDEQEKP